MTRTLVENAVRSGEVDLSVLRLLELEAAHCKAKIAIMQSQLQRRLEELACKEVEVLRLRDMAEFWKRRTKRIAEAESALNWSTLSLVDEFSRTGGSIQPETVAAAKAMQQFGTWNDVFRIDGDDGGDVAVQQGRMQLLQLVPKLSLRQRTADIAECVSELALLRYQLEQEEHWTSTSEDGVSGLERRNDLVSHAHAERRVLVDDARRRLDEAHRSVVSRRKSLALLHRRLRRVERLPTGDFLPPQLCCDMIDQIEMELREGRMDSLAKWVDADLTVLVRR